MGDRRLFGHSESPISTPGCHGSRDGRCYTEKTNTEQTAQSSYHKQRTGKRICCSSGCITEKNSQKKKSHLFGQRRLSRSSVASSTFNALWRIKYGNLIFNLFFQTIDLFLYNNFYVYLNLINFSLESR